MKHLIKILLLFYVIISISSNSVSSHPVNDSVNFSGEIKSAKADRYKYLRIYFNEEDYFRTSKKTTAFERPIDDNGKFKFSLPKLNEPYKIILGTNRLNGNQGLFSRYFYVESGDSIHMQMINLGAMGLKGLIHFSGRGSEKYNLIEELDRQFIKDYYSELAFVEIRDGKVKDTIELNKKIHDFTKLLSKYNKKKSDLINKSKISQQMKNIIRFEFCRYMSEWTGMIQILYKNNPKFGEHIIRKYFLYRNEFYEKPTNASIYCKSFLSGVASRIAWELKLANKLKSVTLEDFYNHIKINYDGPIKDRLIGLALYNRVVLGYLTPSSPLILDSLLRDALNEVTMKKVREGLTKEVLRKEKFNKKIIDAQFTTSNGRLFDLSSLRGKVFLIDVWFNGCGGCAQFHSVFETEIYPKFKNNKDFAVVSLNTDKSLKSWMSGNESGKYSSEEYINVTTSSWFDHPFFKYYNIIAAPFLMLVGEDGTILYQPTSITTKELIYQIELALNIENKCSSKTVSSKNEF